MSQNQPWLCSRLGMWQVECDCCACPQQPAPLSLTQSNLLCTRFLRCGNQHYLESASHP